MDLTVRSRDGVAGLRERFDRRPHALRVARRPGPPRFTNLCRSTGHLSTMSSPVGYVEHVVVGDGRIDVRRDHRQSCPDGLGRREGHVLVGAEPDLVALDRRVAVVHPEGLEAGVAHSELIVRRDDR